MLSQLSIRDIVLIERLDLTFEPGLSVLTGETGAGKSILLDALSLALGARGDGSLVRQGAERGQVSAVFDVPADHAARRLVRESGLDDEGDLILRRVQTADGRTRVFLNDQPTSVSTMRAVGRLLVEIHGQHDDRALVDTDIHRLLLDAFGGLAADAAETAALHGGWREAARALETHRRKVAEAAREADYLRSSFAELEALAPLDGEEEELAGRRADMMKAERIASDIREADDVLNGQGSPLPLVSSLLRKLERKSAEAPGLLEETVEALDTALRSLGDAQMAVEAAMRKADFDPHELERAEERLFALRAAGRKYDVPVAALPELAHRMMDELADLDAGEEKLVALDAAAGEARSRFDAAAAALSARRHEAAGGLTDAVMKELPALKLERAAFIVHIETDAETPSADGIDRVAFHVRTNPGTRAGPIMKVASGGELSRFLLALKVALADRGSAPTLVFDEIDTGVGGAVADAIGQRLKRLASGVQVLSVTHAPQVAARAGTHFLIAKGASKKGASQGASNGPDDAEAVATRVTAMDEAGRREEIARMLAGATITAEARAAAARLLSGNA